MSRHFTENIHPPTAIYAAHPLRLDSSKHIRLIRVVPYASPQDQSVENDCPSTVTVEIHTVPLESAPPYIALSYVWGPPEPSRLISVAGQPLQIRENLWGFLDHVSATNDIGFLWIDALCIDQSSIPERNHQVAMMGQIYGGATKVISWLGTGPPELVEAVSKLAYDDGQLLLRERSLERERFVTTLRNAPYWRRAWIVQEVSLARDLELWCGPQRMSRSSLKRWSQEQRLVLSLEISRRIWSMISDFEPREIMSSVLKKFSSELGECVDFRDRVYSVLSLVQPESLDRFPIIVDYGKSSYALFCELIDINRRQFPTCSAYLTLDHAVRLQRMLDLHTDSRVTRLVDEMYQRMSVEWAPRPATEQENIAEICV